MSIKCSSCGREVEETHNFCRWCGKFLKKCCVNCKKQGNSDCNEPSCPDYRLHMLEVNRAKYLRGLLGVDNRVQ